MGGSLDGPKSVFPERRLLPARRELVVSLVRRIGEAFPLQEWDDLLEQSSVPGPSDRSGQDPREPEEVVRAARAYASHRSRVPPVEDVSLPKLATCSLFQLFDCERGIEREEGVGVLELVAEPEGAARLVEAGSAPEPRGDRLVGEPPVHQGVEGGVRGLDPDAAQVLAPPPMLRLRRARGPGPGAELSEQGVELASGVRRAEEEGGLTRLAGSERDVPLEDAAPLASGEAPLPRHISQEPVGGAVEWLGRSEELTAIRRHPVRQPVEAEECHLSRVLEVVGVSCRHDGAFGVETDLQSSRGVGGGRAENPVCQEGGGEVPRPGAPVFDPDSNHLDGKLRVE